MNPITLLEAALEYANRGWPVLPLHTPTTDGTEAKCSCGRRACSSVGKHPRTPRGIHDASTDPEVIRRWWSVWADANVGIATGGEGGIFVVDIDPRNGGETTLADLEAQNGKLPPTLTVSTGGGGKHLFFEYPRDGLKRKNKLGPGVDIKMEGGYVVAAPSLHRSGDSYAWVDANAKIASAPAWLLDMLATGSKKRRPRVASDDGCSAKAAGAALGREVIITRLHSLKEPDKRALMRKVLSGKPFAIPGDRDNALQRIASILAFVAPDDEPEALASILEPSLAAMAAEYNDSDNPALTLDDAVEKIKRAQRDAHEKRATENAKREAFLDKLTRRVHATDSDAASDDYQQPGEIPGKAGIIVELICRQFELFRSPEGKFYASKGGNIWEIRSKEFKNKISYFMIKSLGQVPSESTLNNAISAVEAIAHYEGAEYQVNLRVAQFGDAIYLDLADSSGQVVEVTAAGWKIILNPPVKFRRPHGMCPLPSPIQGGNLEELRRLINIGTGTEADRNWALILAWLVAALRPRGPHPVLGLHGEQGSAKTTLARMLRNLVDPSAGAVRAEPRDIRDLAIAADHNWILAVDNISYIPDWLSDALCRLVTGSVIATRTLYENRAEELFVAQRPIILNGIGESTTRSDLLDRAILLHLPMIPAKARRTEEELESEFNRIHPRILGSLLDAVSLAIREHPTVKLDKLPRMADFTTWAVAAESGLGLAPGAFMAAYDKNRGIANKLALECSPLYGVIERYLAPGRVTLPKTASALLAELYNVANDAELRQKGWPRGPNALTESLRRLAPNLREVGIDVHCRRNRKGCLVTIKRTKAAAPVIQVAVGKVTKAAPGPIVPPVKDTVPPQQQVMDCRPTSVALQPPTKATIEPETKVEGDHAVPAESQPAKDEAHSSSSAPPPSGRVARAS